MAAVRPKFRTLAKYLETTTQDALAKKLGVSRSYISFLASGKRQPGLKLALRIEAVTGVPAEALVAHEREAVAS